MPKMFYTFALLAALLLSLGACSRTEPLEPPPALGETIPGQYIVVLEKPALEAQGGGAPTELDIASVATSLGVQSLGELRSIGGFIAGDVDAAALEQLTADPRVRYAEPDRVVKLSGVQRSPTWGLDRIDDRSLSLDKTFNYSATGSGVNAYVIDSGIKRGNEFGSRIIGGISAINDSRGYSDCNGHGTHVAGTLGGKTYGVAKSVKLYAIRVFGCNGTSSSSKIVSGIDWVTFNHKAPAVANLSMESKGSASIDAAVRAAVAEGVTVVAAAGNGSTNACRISPARVGEALTIGASTRQDGIEGLSNYGGCLDLFAPGEDILSVGLWGKETMTGTSMAAPHVSGVAALILQKSPSASPRTVASRIQGLATKGKLDLEGAAGSPNRLLYTNF